MSYITNISELDDLLNAGLNTIQETTDIITGAGVPDNIIPVYAPTFPRLDQETNTIDYSPNLLKSFSIPCGNYTSSTTTIKEFAWDVDFSGMILYYITLRRNKAYVTTDVIGDTNVQQFIRIANTPVPNMAHNNFTKEVYAGFQYNYSKFADGYGAGKGAALTYFDISTLSSINGAFTPYQASEGNWPTVPEGGSHYSTTVNWQIRVKNWTSSQNSTLFSRSEMLGSANMSEAWLIITTDLQTPASISHGYYATFWKPERVSPGNRFRITIADRYLRYFDVDIRFYGYRVR